MTALSLTNISSCYNPFYVVVALVQGVGCSYYVRTIKSYATELEALNHRDAAEAYLVAVGDAYQQGDIDPLGLDTKLRTNPWDNEAIYSEESTHYLVLEVFQP